MTPRRKILPLFIPHAGCPHNCVFCSQRRISGHLAPVTAAEVAAALAAMPFGVDELAFYGGSFTALPVQQQRELLDAVQPWLQNGLVGSIRVSTRPDAVDTGVLSLLKSRGVSAVELGAQSMDDAVLAACGRGHSAADTVRAARLVREGGFRLGLQMMTGLPGSSEALDLMTGERLAALLPDGVRIYPTVVLEGTELCAMWRRGAYQAHTVEEAVSVCARLLPLFDAAGIPVIRLGLNPTEALSAGAAVAGAYHPALGELVRSRVYLNRARALLQGSRPGDRIALGVCKSDISQMVGQHRCNLAALRAEFQPAELRVTEAAVKKGEITVTRASCGVRR